MAVQIRSDYPRGASRTRVSGLTPSPGVPQMGGRDAETYLREMLRREDLAQRRPRRAERVPVAAASRAMSRPSPKLAVGRRGGAALQRAQAEAAYNEAMNRTLAAQSARRRAPTRVTHGAGMTPGRVMDPGAMSAIERQMFLPSESKFTLSGEEQQEIAATSKTGKTKKQREAESGPYYQMTKGPPNRGHQGG